MERVYRLLPWLDMAQAVDYLQDLIKAPLTESLLLQHCYIGECSVYMDCWGYKGETLLDCWRDDEEIHLKDLPSDPVEGRGYCKVESPELLCDLESHGIHLTGPAWIPAERRVQEDCRWWIPSESPKPAPVFKNADIRELAARMNCVPEQPSAAEVEALRRQLEQERAARQAAEKRAEQADQAVVEAMLLDEPSPKGRNSYLRTIAALGYALIDGSTGQPYTDAGAMLAALAAKGIEAPLRSGTLAEYLKQVEGV